MSLVSTEWLFKNKENVKIIDSSWHLPSEKKDSFVEYNLEHIPNSVYFDIDTNSDQNSDLPHMLPEKNRWEEIMSDLGISNKDNIIIYDNSNLVSSCRLWYTLLYFGHKKELVHVLDGGIEKWKNEKLPLTDKKTFSIKSNYTAKENKEMVKNMHDINLNLERKIFKLIDGRSKDRFDGKIEEPRKGLRGGSIKNSKCLPFQHVLNHNKTFKSKDELKILFNKIIDNTDTNNVVFSCGSGITACVLALAYSLINNNYNPTIYDGSWAEYGKILK